MFPPRSKIYIVCFCLFLFACSYHISYSDEIVSVTAVVIGDTDITTGGGTAGGGSSNTEIVLPNTITFSGTAYPYAKVILLENGIEKMFVKATKDGSFSFMFTDVSKGVHMFSIVAENIYGKRSIPIITPLSVNTNTITSIDNIFFPPITSFFYTADLNGDNKVTIADFSIMSFWYKKENPPQNVDLNNDGKVTLTDFSIMAYQWNG